MKVKYVIINYSFPIIFGEYYKHDVFIRHGEITSAGFCNINTQSKIINCYGESISLGVKSSPHEDKKLIGMLFNF